MRCAIYARVSTADETTENQLLELRDYAARSGFTATESTTRSRGPRNPAPRLTG